MDRIALAIGYAVMVVAGLAFAVMLVVNVAEVCWRKLRAAGVAYDLIWIYLRHGRRRVVKKVRKDAQQRSK